MPEDHDFRECDWGHIPDHLVLKARYQAEQMGYDDIWLVPMKNGKGETRVEAHTKEPTPYVTRQRHRREWQRTY